MTYKDSVSFGGMWERRAMRDNAVRKTKRCEITAISATRAKIVCPDKAEFTIAITNEPVCASWRGRTKTWTFYKSRLPEVLDICERFWPGKVTVVENKFMRRAEVENNESEDVQSV